MQGVLKPHLSLNVSDIDASVAFYERAFGVPATKRRPGYAKFDLASPLLNLSMAQAPRTGFNASHFGVQLARTEDVVAHQERLKAAGLPTFAEDQTSCCYAVQDKVWITDPDGNAWEFFTVLGDSPLMSEEAGSTCCTVEVPSTCTIPEVCAATPAGASCGCS